MRDDLLLRDYAESLGFTYKHEQDALAYPLVFSKGGYRVWRFAEGWQTARVVDGRYTGHKPFGGLGAALDYVKSVTGPSDRWPMQE